MINFDFNSIVEGLKEYYSEKAAELLAKYLLENEQGSSLPIIAVLNEDNNEYEVFICKGTKFIKLNHLSPI